jgi:hypothetical protein
MARPKKENATRQIGANVAPELADRIRQYSSYLRLSQSWVIHQLLTRGLQAVEADGYLGNPMVPLPPASAPKKRRRKAKPETPTTA